MSPIVTEAELAQLLKVDAGIVTRLVLETALPRVEIAGERRFITHEVLTWLSDERVVLSPHKGEVKADAKESATIGEVADQAETLILPAEEDEAPFIAKEALSSLGRHAADPSYNLMRQQVRDGLAAIGDALHPTLVRLSSERLNTAADDKVRTSPWRLDDSMECIDHITMSWAQGAGPPGFSDRPRIALTLTSDAVEFSVQVPEENPAPRPDKSAFARARASGAMISLAANKKAWSVTYLYEIVRGTPTVAKLGSRLSRDAKTLVPLWDLALKGGPRA